MPANSDLFEIGEIDNVTSSAWKLAWTRYRIYTICLIPIGIILFLGGLFVPHSFVFLFVILAIYSGYVYTKAQSLFMRQFALANGFLYMETAPVESARGSLFGFGNSRMLSHVLSGIYQSHPMRLFHYTYSTGSGKNKTTRRFTVF